MLGYSAVLVEPHSGQLSSVCTHCFSIVSYSIGQNKKVFVVAQITLLDWVILSLMDPRLEHEQNGEGCDRTQVGVRIYSILLARKAGGFCCNG